MRQLKVITKVIRRCRDCPHDTYNSGGMHVCLVEDRSYPEQDAHTKIQPWCPLDDAPASLT